MMTLQSKAEATLLAQWNGDSHHDTAIPDGL